MSLEIIDGHELSALSKGHGAMEGVLELIIDRKRTRTLTEARENARMALTLVRAWMSEAKRIRAVEVK